MARFLTAFNRATSSQQILSVLNTIQANGGQVLNAWGDSVLIGEGDPGLIDAVANSDGVAYATDSLIPDPAAFDLDEVALDLGAAWRMGLSPFYQQILDNFVNQNIDPRQALAPGGCVQNGGIGPAGGLFNPASLLGISGSTAPARALPNRRAFVGTIGVAVLQIDGPDGSVAAFTLDDWFIALISLSRAFNFLQSTASAQAHLVFTTAIHKVKLNLPPFTPASNNFEAVEAIWRNPALQALGMGTGPQGYQNLLNNSRFMFNVDWCFVFVLTKYRAARPGYADFNHVVVSYLMEAESGLLGILPLICAHEIGHTNGTRDEYGSCSVFDKTGFSNAPNLNCENLNPVSVNCLMRDLSQMICIHTQSHFGWGDIDLDTVIDAYDPDFIPFP